MLLGEFEGKIDQKGRVALPKKFREVLSDQLIITKGYEESLIVVSIDEWETLLEGTEGKPLIQRETREVQRFLLGGASDVSLDKKGRIILPSSLRSFAKIESDLVFLGLSRYIEIWAKQRWDEHREVLENNIGRISEKLVPWEIKEAKNE